MIEPENWTIAVKHYEGHPIPALLLAHQLMAIRQSLQRGRKGIPEAVAGLDLAIESLYLHTNSIRSAIVCITAQLKAPLRLIRKKNSVSLAKL